MLEVYDELFEQFFLFHKDIFMGFFLSWEDEYRDLFLSAKETMFFSCLLVGKVLPSHWQGFATALEKLCHRHGNKACHLRLNTPPLSEAIQEGA